LRNKLSLFPDEPTPHFMQPPRLLDADRTKFVGGARLLAHQFARSSFGSIKYITLWQSLKLLSQNQQKKKNEKTKKN
jgi:hypothetical protein